MTKNFKILDCTLRDGGYYNNWNFEKKLVNEYLRAINETNIQYIELVKNSSVVWLHTSTSISYAILFKKPSIFLTSYNLKKSWIGPMINNLAKVVNGQIINMDNDLNKPLDLQNLLKIDESKYKNYLDQYLKVPNSPDVPLWEIFTNYIKSNQFGK